MRFHTFLLKYGEIGIKGKNRYLFEDALVRQVRYALKDVDGNFDVHKSQARIYVDCEGDYDYEDTVEHLKRVFGLVGICPVVRMEDKGFEELKKDVVAYMAEMYPDRNFTFKVESRRARKSYPKNSMEISRDLGEAILYAFPEIKVDVHHPDVLVNVEVRNEIYVYSEIIPGAGGMPVGTNGNAMLLLSGGIDSPVAGYMVSKRGVGLEATYFHAPPYTSERAKQKVVDLAKIVARYSGPIKLHVVNFTDIQLYIYDKCPHDELTIIMRRYMMRIAEEFARRDGCLGLVTGESIGQVASQTMQSLAATNDVCTMPVYRPLIGFDKQDIVDVAEKIDTYETSILPFEDCCTIFVAKHPVTKPNIEVIRRSEENLAEKIDELMQTALDTAEIIEVKNKKRRTFGYSKEMVRAIMDTEKYPDRKVMTTIITRKGSAPQGIGVKMLVLADGNCIGTIGGGCMESAVLQKALLLLRSDDTQARICQADLTGNDAEDEGMVCGGMVDVLLEVIE